MDHNPLAGWLDGGEGAAPSLPPREQKQPESPELQPESPGLRGRDARGLRRPRRLRLLLLAAVPWVLVLALVARSPSARTQPDVGAATPAHHPANPSQSPRTPVAAQTPDPTPATRAVPPVPTAASEGAQAALAVRNALTLPAGEHGAASYVDFAIPEAWERVGPHTVVTVRAVVLHGDAEGWRSTRVSRYAVPLLDAEEGPTVAGAPWPVAVDDVRRRALPWTDADADHGAVVAALKEAGFSEISAVLLDERGGVPGLLRARFSAAGATEPSRRRHVVWLSTEPAIRVLGYDP